MAPVDDFPAASGEKAPFLSNSPVESCVGDVPLKASERGQPLASLSLFHPLVPSREREVRDWPFLVVAVALALGWLVFVGRQAAFFSPLIPYSLSLLPALALGLALGVATSALFLWLASRVNHELLCVCTWITVGVRVLEILALALFMAFLHSISLAAQRQQQHQALSAERVSVPLLVSGAQIVLSLIILVCIGKIAAYVWVNTRKDLFPPTTTLIVDTATFFLSKGRKILLLLLACFFLSALLLLPVFIRIIMTAEACKAPHPSRGRGTREVDLGAHTPSLLLLFLHPRSLAVAAGLGHATSTSLAIHPLPNARALYQLVDHSGKRLGLSIPLLSPFSPPHSPSAGAPHPSPECKALLAALMPGSPSSLVFAILGLFLFAWVSRVLASAFVFLSSFLMAEEAAASASASSSVCRTPLVHILRLCFWHSLGTFTFASFLMDLLTFAAGILTVVLVRSGAPLLAVTFLSLALLLLLLFHLLYYKLVVPLVAIHGCSLFEAFSKALRLLLTFPLQILFLQVASYGLIAVLAVVCFGTLAVAKFVPVELLLPLYGANLLGLVAVTAAAVGSSLLIDCVVYLWAGSLGGALVNSLYHPATGQALLQGQEPMSCDYKLCGKAAEGGKLKAFQA